MRSVLDASDQTTRDSRLHVLMPSTLYTLCFLFQYQHSIGHSKPCIEEGKLTASTNMSMA